MLHQTGKIFLKKKKKNFQDGVAEWSRHLHSTLCLIPPLICLPLPSPIWSMPESQLEIFSGLSVHSKECCWVAELEQRTSLETCCSGSLQLCSTLAWAAMT